jgi:pimeloyl-ACP methyl ester carboxylesterase
MYKSTNFLRKLSGLLLITTVLSGALPVFAQKKSATTQPKQTQAKCSGAWTGVVSYTRTQTMKNEKTVERVSARGEDKTNWEMKYDYKARVKVVDSPERNGSSVAKADIEHTFSSIEKTVATEKNSCDRGKTWKTMTGNFTSKTATSGRGENESANINVGVNADGTYTVSVGLPQIKGKATGEQTSVFSGQCTAKEGKTLTLPETETSIDGNSLTSDGKNRVNPDDPNRLSGSYSTTWQGVTEKITWNLEKCGAPLRLTELKFEHMKFPKWDDWQEITEQTGTIDGNLVKIKAKVLNTSGETKYGDVKFKETYKGDKWDGAKPDAPLNDTVVSARVEAGEEKEVEIIWDSSGYAWYDDGRPRLVQRIKAELEENGKKANELTENLKVAPKPVVLVHGLWSNWKAFETWQNILTTSHSYDWKAFPVGEKAENGTMNTGGSFMSSDPTKSIEENARVLQAYIKYAQEDRNAWHIDVVAHSMGGLIARYYIHNIMQADSMDVRPKISHLVMLGTPNQGSPCADVMDFAFSMTGKNVEAVRQLRTDVVNKFNGLVFNSKGVKFSALAGNPLPTMCKTVEWNDGVVSVPSALYRVSDTAKTSSLHTDLTGTSDFSSFVKPHLAIGPKGDHNPAPYNPNMITENRNPNAAMFVNAAYRSESSALADGSTPASETSALNPPANADGSDLRPSFAKAVKLAPKQSVEIEIPVEAANNFGLTFMADANISATLFNDKSVTVGKNLAKTPEASGWFRSIFVEKDVTKGTWKLKLENTSDKEFEVVIAAWDNAGK